MSEDTVQLRIHGRDGLPNLIYLPGLHGDWTLISGFRRAVANRVRLMEFTYPRSLTWTIPDYAVAVEQALSTRDINVAWLLAESWGSQVAWQLLANQSRVANKLRPARFIGLILAGGFVKHPWNWGPPTLRWLGRRTPRVPYQMALSLYKNAAQWLCRRHPDSVAAFAEFAARRTDLDRQVMWKRLELLANFDPRPFASRTDIPVHYLNGSVDPLIPWLLVRRWLRKNCPGYRGGKTCWLADHAVLASAPERAAASVLHWMAAAQSADNP